MKNYRTTPAQRSIILKTITEEIDGASGTSSTQGAQGAGAGNQQAAHVDLSKQLELGMMQAQIKALEAGAKKDDADAKNKEQDRLLKEQQTLKLT